MHTKFVFAVVAALNGASVLAAPVAVRMCYLNLWLNVHS
jgi:hypothetical protein